MNRVGMAVGVGVGIAANLAPTFTLVDRQIGPITTGKFCSSSRGSS